MLDMNTELRKSGKNDFEYDFFKPLSYGDFGKKLWRMWENIEISSL